MFSSASLFSTVIFAFPASLVTKDITPETLAEITALAARIKEQAERSEQVPNVKRGGFNADAQRVSTTGDHAYVSVQRCNTILSTSMRGLTVEFVDCARSR